MARRRRTEITMETRRVVFLRGRSGEVQFCPWCGGAAAMASPEVSAAMAGVSIRAIFRWMETGEVHFVDAGGGLSVCVNSCLRPKPPEGEE